MTTLMTCGHAPNAKSADGTPVCVICDCSETAPAVDLTGRIARCSYYGHKCKSETASAATLAYFLHTPESDADQYYCGCWGWD